MVPGCAHKFVFRISGVCSIILQLCGAQGHQILPIEEYLKIIESLVIMLL